MARKRLWNYPPSTLRLPHLLLLPASRAEPVPRPTVGVAQVLLCSFSSYHSVSNLWGSFC